MSQLPNVQRGYLLRNTSTMLFFIYAHVNHLQDVVNAQYTRPDTVMTEAFGGGIPATFLSYKDPNSPKKSTKIPMTEAIARGAVQAPGINTFNMIGASHPPGQAPNKKTGKMQDVGFNPARFNSYFFQNIAAANYYSRASLQQSQDPNIQQHAALLYPGNPAGSPLTDVQQGMLDEHETVKHVSAAWYDVLEPQRKQQSELRKAQREAAKRQARG